MFLLMSFVATTSPLAPELVSLLCENVFIEVIVIEVIEVIKVIVSNMSKYTLFPHNIPTYKIIHAHIVKI